jgi:sigma-B regulation protein RsbU (phosphoserine phosphatase)
VTEPDLWGNLVGEGNLVKMPAPHQAELRRTLALAPWLSAMAFKLPAISEARYASREGWVLMHPWRPSATVDAGDLSTMAAATDPQRQWGPVQFAGQDRGLQAPLQAPVIEDGQTLGWLRLWLSLDHLNRINNDWGQSLGHAFVVNDAQQVLAHPRLYEQPLQVRTVPDLSQTELGAWSAQLAQWPSHTRFKLGEWWVYRVPFRSASWSLVYAVKRHDLWASVWRHQVWTLVGIMSGMFGLMFMTLVMTRREFVQPSLQLVQFLGFAAKHEQADIPRVPEGWRPWFEQVKVMMRESRQLVAVEQELRIATQMQQSILPTDWPDDARHALSGTMRAARHVGGDFYDHLTTQSGWLNLIVADVSGKGMGAALFGMVSKTHFRSQMALDPNALPDRLLAGINRALAESNPQCMFVTAMCIRYNPDTGDLWWSGAGHPPALWVSHEGQAQWWGQEQGISMGLEPDAAYPLYQHRLQAGDQVIWITDGVTEAIDEAMQEFGMQRVRDLVEKHPDLSGGALIQCLIEAVDAFAGTQPQFDDITCMVLIHKGGAA